MKEEMIIIVDENDKIVGSKARSKIDLEDIYRVSSLIINNKKGEVLLGKRAAAKKNNPNLWSPIVNGTNAKGESYKENIIRETKEEINLELDNIELVSVEKIFDKHKHFIAFFRTIIGDNTKLDFDPNEISEVKWFSRDELFTELNNNPEKFIPQFYKKLFHYIFTN